MRPLVSAVVVLAAFAVRDGAAEQGAAARPAPAAQSRTIDIKDGSTVAGKYVTLRVGTAAATVAPGGRASLLVTVTPGPKMHVYAPGQQGYIPISLAVAPSPAFRAHPIVYPPSKPYEFLPLMEKVQVYGDPFQLRRDITVAASADLKRRAAAAATLGITGSLTYQACDDAVCYRPEVLAVEWKVKLVPTGR